MGKLGYADKNNNESVNNKVTFVDLFSGIGGFHLGICQASEKLNIGSECLLSVDINKKAQLTYSRNFVGTQQKDDVCDDDVKKTIFDGKKVDIVCGGFPCQPFSLAGKKKGIKDDRGMLFKHIVEILETKKPKVVFLENVRNLMNIKNDDGGKTIDVIKLAMEEAGYPVQIRNYKATDFGLPTYRSRIYLVGFKNASHRKKFKWPEPTHDKDITLKEYFSTLEKKWYAVNPDIEIKGWPDRIGNTLRVGGCDSGFRTTDGKRWRSIKDGDARRDKRNWDSYMFFDGDKSKMVEHRLTVNEAKAIMGFPHDYIFPEVLSKRDAMKQLGNSVAVPVIEAIAKNIIDAIYD
ncbi:MAG: DNA (cytosine-5-)-methyltransferase [Candidatus Paceibacterota bacterium]|jgi:DNA (cytosine-5)-methyltransferase 1